VDQFAFAAAGKETTTASLDLNLPSLDSPGNPQIERVTLGGTVEATDTYSVTVNGTTITYTVTGAEANIGAIRDALVTAINANTTVNAAITAAANGEDSITLTAKKPGTAFTASTAAVNNGGTADNTAVSVNTQPNKVATNPRVFNAKAFDSNGKARTVVLNFEKTTTQNQWNLTVTTDRDAVAQIDTVTLTGTVEGTDTFSATVNGTTVTYTVTGAEANIDAIRDGLVTAINANATVSGTVTAAAGTGTGQLTLTAKTAGTTFTASAAAANRTAVAQSDSITIGGTFEVGDIYTV
jgi:flagellar hook protein FlgE